MADITAYDRGEIVPATGAAVPKKYHDNGDDTFSEQVYTNSGSGPSASQTQGNVAHDAADSGNPVKVGGKAETTVPTAVADGDRVDFWVDEYGRQNVKAGGITAVLPVIFTLDTSAYASGDLVADTQEIANAVRVNDGTAILSSITLNDKDDQGVELYFVFLSANRSLGTENSAPSPSDAFADDILGWVKVQTSDYLDLGGAKVASLRGINLPVKGASGSTSIYVAVVNSTGTPTYSASGLVARFGFLQD